MIIVIKGRKKDLFFIYISPVLLGWVGLKDSMAVLQAVLQPVL
jgi:hypothetical protein